MQKSNNAESAAHGSQLHDAASRGDVSAIASILTSAPNAVAWRDDLVGETALHCAAMHGQVVAIERLLEHGAEIDARDQSGTTPLLDSLFANQLESCSLLLDCGADATVRYNEGFSAFYWATSSVDVLRLLLLRVPPTQAVPLITEHPERACAPPTRAESAASAAGESERECCTALQLAAAFHCDVAAELERYLRAPARYRAAHSPLVQLALGAAALDWPVLLTLAVAECAAQLGRAHTHTRYSPAAAWRIGQLVKRAAGQRSAAQHAHSAL